jgi:flagellar FliL protein
MLGKGKKDKKAKDGQGGDAEAATAPAEGAEGEGAAKKKFPMMIVIIAVVVVALLGGGGATAFLLLGKHKPPPAKVAEAKPKKKEKKKEGKDAKPAEGMGTVTEGPGGVSYYNFPTVLSDMQGTDGRPGQIKVDMTFEIANADIGDNINENMPRVKDMLQTFLRELRPEDLSGSEGTFRLRQELLRRVNLIIAPEKINTINLTGIVIS